MKSKLWIIGTFATILSASNAFAGSAHVELVAQAAKTQPSRAARAQRIEVEVNAEGFVPAQTRVKVGQPVTLVAKRNVERTCATDVVLREFGISKALPLNVPVEVRFTPTRPGKVRFTCAMDMIAGELVAE